MTNYFLISSPLHFFIATNLAISKKDQINIAVFMSKNQKTAQQYAKASEQFKAIFQHTFDLTAGHTGNKQQDRKKSFSKLEEIIVLHQPDCIFTGNDRRVEFQYAMHYATRRNKNVKGIYIDDGAISYLGHKSLDNFTHRYIDPLLKKLFYGVWWKNPLTTGASQWISEAYLAFPEYAHPLLESKKILPLEQDIFSSAEFIKVNQYLTESYNELDAIEFKKVKVVLCLPYESFYLGNDRFITKITTYLNEQYKADEIAIKAHPRSKNIDFLKSVFSNSVILPSTLGMELLLPKLHQETSVLGDISTTLLTTKWLRPELTIKALELSSTEQPELKKLFENLSIKLITL